MPLLLIFECDLMHHECGKLRIRTDKAQFFFVRLVFHIHYFLRNLIIVCRSFFTYLQVFTFISYMVEQTEAMTGRTISVWAFTQRQIYDRERTVNIIEQQVGCKVSNRQRFQKFLW